MAEELQVTLTGVVGDTLWGVDTRDGEAVVWDQSRAAFRVPTHQESMGAKAQAARQGGSNADDVR